MKSTIRKDIFLKAIQNKFKFQTKIRWRQAIFLTFFHILCCVWSYLYAFPVKWQTFLFGLLFYWLGGVGITCGCHRLWTHKAYKATLPLKIFLVFCFATNGQMSVYNWVKIHRQHHKYSDTAADPHDSTRGFFYSHIGWLMLEKSDLIKEKRKQIDMSDIEADEVLKLDKKYSNIILFVCVFLPILIPIYFWGENWKCAATWVILIKNLFTMHGGLSVNSFSHKYGYRPYNKHIVPTDNLWITICTSGEGIHNYHHTFPYDYRCSESADYFNASGCYIWLWAKMGLAYDLKEARPELVKATVTRLNSIDRKTIDSIDIKRNIPIT